MPAQSGPTTRRPPRGAGRIALAALAVGWIAAACVAGPAGSDGPSATPVVSGSVTPEVTGAPLSAPPVTPVAPSETPPLLPSTSPMPAGLIVRLDVCADVCIDPRRDEYLDDGRVIHLDLATGRLMERRLSPAGLARVEARVAEDADLLDADRSVDPVPLQGKEPPGHGAISYTFLTPIPAGGNARVRTVTSGSLDPGYWTPDRRIDRLTALGDALLAPEAVAGPDGWADAAWALYRPDKVAVFVHAREGTAPFSSPGFGPAGWPGVGDPRAFAEPFASPLDAWPIARCATLDRDAATTAVAALPAVLDPADPDAFWREGAFGWESGRSEILVVVRTLLPDEEAVPCGGLWAGL